MWYIKLTQALIELNAALFLPADATDDGNRIINVAKET